MLKWGKIAVQVLATNLNDHVIALPQNKQIAIFRFLSPQEEEELKEIGPELLALDKMKDGKF